MNHTDRAGWKKSAAALARSRRRVLEKGGYFRGPVDRKKFEKALLQRLNEMADRVVAAKSATADLHTSTSSRTAADGIDQTTRRDK